MRTILVIGIGAGSPEFLTLQAISGLRRAQAVVALDKGETKSDLLALRQGIVDTHAPGTPIVAVTDPERDRAPKDYDAEVLRWHKERANLLAEAIRGPPQKTEPWPFLCGGTPRSTTLRCGSSII